MTFDSFISLLDGVKQTRRGWEFQCPAHADQHPSGAVTVGKDGRILVKCWAGCTAAEITGAMGLRLADLFPDSKKDPAKIRREQRKREKRKTAVERARHDVRARLDALREAEGLVVRARNIDIAAWTHSELDHAVDQVADAYDVLATEEGGRWGQ